MKQYFVIAILFVHSVATVAQNVGIGTTTPQWKLDVRGGNPDDGQLISVGNSDQSHRLLFFGGRQNDPNPFLQWKDGDPLRFGTDLNGFTELMRINSNGNVGIGINTIPDSSALFELNSNNKGLLIPRMVTSAISSIAGPAKGLMAYDTVKNQLMVNIGTPSIPNWQTVVFNSGWSLAGNNGTNPAVNFVGTADNTPLRFKVNGTNAGLLAISNLSTYLGYKSGLQNPSGYANTGIGAEAFSSNTTNGDYCTAVGAAALYYDTSFGYNTAIGSLAMLQNRSGFANTAVGSEALYYSKFGDRNTAVGSGALYADSVGTDNTSIGEATLFSNTHGSYNTVAGAYALYNHIKSNFNTAVGYYALNSDTSGQDNAALGVYALYSSQNSNSNTAIGKECLYSTLDGHNNTAAGYQALYANTTGSNNTAIGSNANVGSAGLINATAIGANAIVTSSNSIQLGNNSVSLVNTYGSITVLNGKGLIRSATGTQLKELTATVVVNATISGQSTISIPFNFPESFSGLPDVYVGNVTGGAGGFAEVIMSVANVTTSGGSLFVNNPSSGSYAPNFSIKVVAIGPQ